MMHDEKEHFVGGAIRAMSALKNRNGRQQSYSAPIGDCDSLYAVTKPGAQNFTDLSRRTLVGTTRKISIDEKIEHLKKELDFLRRTSRKHM